MDQLINLLRSLNPFANFWNAIILVADLIIFFCVRHRYKATKSRQLINSLPGIFTSLGLLGTFGAICTSLSVISTNDVDTASRVGKSLAEAGQFAGDLNLKKIISDLIPAFSTSIYGLVFAIMATIWAKFKYATEDSELEQKLKFKNTEEVLEDLDCQLVAVKEAINEEINTNNQNNDKLTETIQAQSEIFSKFVDTFVSQMEETFSTMKETIGARVSAFGEEQYKQSRTVLETLTEKLTGDASAILQSHNQSVKDMADANAQEIKAMSDNLQSAVSTLQVNAINQMQTLTATQNQALQKMAEDCLASQKTQQNAMDAFSAGMLEKQQAAFEKQSEFNESLINNMSTSLSETMSKVISSLDEQCLILQEALRGNVEQLEKAYGFIDEKSSAIISNYEQSSEAYRAAIQNAHDINDSVGKSIRSTEDTLKAIEKTNKGVDEIISTISEKETNMEAIVMRIEELGKAIATIQKLEASLNKIASR